MSEKIRMKARDSFYASDTKQVHAGQVYEVESEARAKEREAAGDTRVTDAKAEPAPQNKAEPAPANKEAANSRQTTRRT